MKENFCGTKYTVVYDKKTGDLYALRYGERWRNLTGDGMVMAMLQAAEAERALLRRARSALGLLGEFCADLVREIEHHFEEHANETVT